MEIHLNDRIAEVNILETKGNLIKAEVDGKIYEVDFAKIGSGTYSFLLNGKSIEMEVSSGDNPRVFDILHHCLSFQTEVVDAEARYMKNRKQGELDDDANVISSPMPGKVVKLLVDEGDKVEAGQTLIIISAMKMESEYKAKHAGVVSKILTEEGATIDGNQPLIILD
jgi:biotin carboxyl carrier protein